MILILFELLAHLLPVHSFLEVFADLEKRELLRSNNGLITCLGVPACVSIILTDRERTESSYLYSPPGQKAV